MKKKRLGHFYMTERVKNACDNNKSFLYFCMNSMKEFMNEDTERKTYKYDEYTEILIINNPYVKTILMFVDESKYMELAL